MKKKVILTIILLLYTSSLFCQENIENIELSLKEAVRLGLKNNLDIQYNKLESNKKKWEAATSWNTFVPSVDYTAAMQMLNKAVIDKYTPLEREYITKGSVGYNISLTLTLNAYQVFDIIYKAKDCKSSMISLDLAKKEIETSIKKSYFTLVVLDQNLKITEQNIKSAERRFELAQRKYDTGIYNELDRLKALYSYENLKQEYFEMTKDFENMLMTFKQILGLKKKNSISLIDKVQVKNEYIEKLTTINQQNIERNLEYMLLNQNLKKNIQTRNMYIAALTPSLELDYLIDPYYQKSDPFGKDTDWFNNINEDWKQNSGNLTLEISLSLSSLFPFSKSQMNITKSQYDIAMQKVAIDQMKEDKLLEAATIINTIDKAYHSFKPLKLNVDIAEKVYNLTEASYEIGKQTLFELEEAEDNLNSERLKLLQAEYDYITGICELEYLLNIDILNEEY